MFFKFSRLKIQAEFSILVLLCCCTPLGLYSIKFSFFSTEMNFLAHFHTPSVYFYNKGVRKCAGKFNSVELFKYNYVMLKSTSSAELET